MPHPPTNETLRSLILSDSLRLGTLVLATVALFTAIWFYFNAYAHYRATHGLDGERAPGISLPSVHLRSLRR